jgi:hypothetical protein
MPRLLQEFLRHVLPGIVKPLRALMNEILGFVFLCFALIPLPRAFNQWRQFNETGEGLSRMAVYIFFILMMGTFGIYSFLRARKITRS